MSRLFKLYFFINLNCILIKCLIPENPTELSVRKLDNKLIERKRQDTVDMCRIFTEEFEKLDKMKPKSKFFKKYPNKKSRVKRDLLQVNLKYEDAQIVEKIVDKMYDDLQENGDKVNYGRGAVTTLKSNTSSSNPTGRRYFFAPSILEGPISKQPNDQDKEPSGKTPRFKHGIIPYFIDSKTYDTDLVEIMTNAFDYFEKATCIRLQRLRERPTDNESLNKVEWLHITNPTGIKQCVHSNDQADIKGVQMIVFGYDCMSLGDILHELMHVLGFPHEHVRPDRDQHITILWDNIKPGYKKYFEITKNLEVDLPYDHASVLHYPPRAFSRNGQATIMTQPGIKIGQREGLSEIDVEKISSLYSAECVKRNKEYLLTTCPSVVKAQKPQHKNFTMEDIQAYYADKLWPYGIVNYKISDYTQFTKDELENINAVIRHIEKETCIEFRRIEDEPKGEDDPKSEEIQASTEASVNDNKSTVDENINPVNIKDNNIRTESQGKKAQQSTEKKLNEISPDKAFIGQSENEIKTDDENEKYNIHIVHLANKSERASLELISGRTQRKYNDIQGNKTQTEIQDISLNEKMKNHENKKNIIPLSPSRRHAAQILTFSRSQKPGCICPNTSEVLSTTGKVDINADCFNSVNDLLHLFVHILGLGHQHNSHDRDSYLHIVWDQLSDDLKNDMNKKLPPVASLGFPYDYQSVMHFPWLQIKDGRTNIMYPIWNDGWAMGHWQGLSSTDVAKINIIYNKQCALRKNAIEEANSENARRSVRKS